LDEAVYHFDVLIDPEGLLVLEEVHDGVLVVVVEEVIDEVALLDKITYLLAVLSQVPSRLDEIEVHFEWAA